MKSVTRPLTPGPFATRSQRFPRAPPRVRPSDTAIHGRNGRVETTTITAETTIVAPANNHGALSPNPKAPPEFVVYVSERTPGITLIAGVPDRVCWTHALLSWSRSNAPAATAYSRIVERRAALTAYRRDWACASLMQRSAYGRALSRAFSIGLPQREQIP